MSRKWKIAIIWLAGLAIIALIIMVGMKDSIVRPMREQEAAEMQSDYIDADAYYAENSELLSSYDAKESEKVQTEAEAIEDIRDRGFIQESVTYEYNMDGEIADVQNANKASDADEEHPEYETLYTSSAGELWSISVINGSITAYPISYNLESERGVELVVAESEAITCYDGVSNKFYEAIPNESVLMVYVVDKLDAATLDSLTVEVLKGV